MKGFTCCRKQARSGHVDRQVEALVQRGTFDGSTERHETSAQDEERLLAPPALPLAFQVPLTIGIGVAEGEAHFFADPLPSPCSLVI